MSGKASTSKDISITSPTGYFPEEQQTQDVTAVQQQSTSRGLSPSAAVASSSSYTRKPTFSGPGGTKLINSPETHEKSNAIIEHAPLPTTTSIYTIPGDQQTNDQVPESSTRQSDGIEEDMKKYAKAWSPPLLPYVDSNYQFPAVSGTEKAYEESSKPTEYQENYSSHLPPKSPVQTNESKNSVNIRDKSVGQKRKLDNNNNEEQDNDQQQERSPKRIDVNEEFDNQRNNEAEDLKGQDWKDVLYECISEFRRHLETEEKNLIMLINISHRLQKLYALGVKSIKKIDEDMQSSRQLHPSDAIDKYNKLLFDAMATVEEDF